MGWWFEGDVQPLEFRIVTSAREPPIDPPRSERTWLGTGRDPQQY
jgi:DNA-binding protein H-NS